MPAPAPSPATLTAPTPGSAGERRSPTKGELTRRAILNAAIARFGAEGYRTTAVADIARAAGVGGSVPYAYFESKEALFFAAVDEDAAGVIEEGMTTAFGGTGDPHWREALLFTLLDAVERHPLARRLLGGLEPEVTARVLDIPALVDLRRACGERLRAEQATGAVRPDIDPMVLGSGVVSIMLSLLVSLVQLGRDVSTQYAGDVAAVFAAALDVAPPS